MAKHDDADRWLSDVDLDTVLAMLKDNGAKELLYKILPTNANSKNQVWFASDLSQLAKIPSGEITAHDSASKKRGGVEAVFRSDLDFYWIDQSGHANHAPEAKLIFYPQYPEVRFSGFLKGCRNAPSSLWSKDKRGTEPDRILILGVGNGEKIFGFTLPPESPAAKEIRATGPHDAYGIFHILPFPDQGRGDGFVELMRRLCAIHQRGWVPSTRLNKEGALVPCRASNCNGNTLESLLGIQSNGYALPDFRGWEIKARSITNIDKPGASVVTLFTPEPTSGVYVSESLPEFMSQYGYPDTKGREDRLNFGGVYRAGGPAHERTGLRLVLDGYDRASGRYASSGAIRLLDDNDNEAMAWSFAKLLEHWKVKHAHVAFVPSQMRKSAEREYRYGRNILLGEGAEFGLFLKAVQDGRLYYDPGIKLEGVSTARPKSKKRSQFRINSRDLPTLYDCSRIVDVCTVVDDESHPS
jgi:hypothetical protein